MKTRIFLYSTIFFTLTSCGVSRSTAGTGNDKQQSLEAQKGEEIFIRRCDRCHPGGMAGKGPVIINKPKIIIKTQVRLGFGAMPSFSKKKISHEELNEIVAYLKGKRGDVNKN